MRWSATCSACTGARSPTAGARVDHPPVHDLCRLARTRALGNAALLLGPDPIIDAQAVVLARSAAGSDGTVPTLQIATDGLRPFAVTTAAP